MCYAYPGPRCSAHARTERNKAIARLVELQDNGGTEAAIAEAKAELIAKQNVYDSTPDGRVELEKSIAAEEDEAKRLLQERRLEAGKKARKDALDAYNESRKAKNELTEEQKLEIKRLQTQVDDRINSEEFKGLLAERDKYRNEREEIAAEIVEKQEAYDKGEGDFEDVREAKDRYMVAHNNFIVANHELEQYKDETAQLVVGINDIAGDPGIEYTRKTLGNCEQTVSYDSGTKEWLEQRQGGIGGSDVGSILKLDKKYGTANYNECMKSKVEKYTEEEIAEQASNNSEYTGATGRGNAWEPAIIRRFEQENPEMTVMYTKASWRNKDNKHAYANVDGLLASDGKNPDGILEIKTASDASKWENGVPLGYRAQVLWYMKQTGFKYAHVAVMIDDHEYRSYRIEAGEAIDGTSDGETLEEAMPKINKFWSKVQETRTNGATPSNRPAKSKYKLSKANTESMVNYLAAYRQEDPKETHKAVMTRLNNGEDHHAVMTSMYREADPSNWKKDITSIDLETSTSSEMTGSIIEIGITRRNYKNEVVAEYSERFGLEDERVLDIRGTGMQEVHKIAPEDIRGKRSFRDPEVQAKVRKIMDGSVMLAHNLPYENKWMRQKLDGFAGMNIQKMDTMHISRYHVPETPNNKLESFSEHHGVPYVEAHSALPDAQMTANAFFAWVGKMRSNA